MRSQNIFFIVLSLGILTLINSSCSNQCSGSGTCNLYGVCECYDGFQAADCSESKIITEI